MDKQNETVSRKYPTAVVMTLIICATVIILTIICMIFANWNLNRIHEIVNALPKDLHTVNITFGK